MFPYSGRTDPIPIVLKEDFTGIGKMKEEVWMNFEYYNFVEY